ncbi:MAG: universal stress protein [Gemmatimonadales bacterium]
MFDHILVTIDFSDASVRALRWTVRSFPDARLTLFHAVQKVKASADVRQSLSGKVDPEETAELDAQENIEVLVHSISPDADVILREGPPVKGLERAARDSDADLVVLAAHEQRIWPWDRYDATAEETCDCVDLPVLIFRPTERTGESAV